MMQLLLTIALLACMALGSDAKLRGRSFEELKRKAMHPKLSSKIQGKTLKELGVDRKLQNNNNNAGAIEFFSIYDEFGPSLSGLGETAGFNGLIYNIDKMGDGISKLTIDDVLGALKGTCSVVGTNNDHFCTYEVLLLTNGGVGTVIASGSLTYRIADGGHLIVEATGDDFSRNDGGILSLKYASTGSTNIITGELYLA